MPVAPTYPGVYVQEVPSGVRTIVGVSTSTALFIGVSADGPMNFPVLCLNYSDFAKTFGEDTTKSDLARYMKLFFLNGGTTCYVMRIADGEVNSAITLNNEAGAASMTLTARNAGIRGDSIRATVTYDTLQPEATFNMEVFRWDRDAAGRQVKAASELWRNLTMNPLSASYAPAVITENSKLVTADVAPAPAAGAAFSQAGRPFDMAAAGFGAAWDSIVTPTSNMFQISVGGSTYMTVMLSGAGTITNEATLKTQLKAAVLAALSPLPGNLGANISVNTVAAPPAAFGGADAPKWFQIAHTGLDVFVRPSLTNDVAAALMLGTAQGGLEVGSFAAARPAPTGTSLTPSGIIGATSTRFAALDPSAVLSMNLDGTTIPFGAVAPLGLQTAAGNPAMYRDASTGSVNGNNDGLREKLALVAKFVADFVPPPGTEFPWSVNVWGYRLNFIGPRRPRRRHRRGADIRHLEPGGRGPGRQRPLLLPRHDGRRHVPDRWRGRRRRQPAQAVGLHGGLSDRRPRGRHLQPARPAAGRRRRPDPALGSGQRVLPTAQGVPADGCPSVARRRDGSGWRRQPTYRPGQGLRRRVLPAPHRARRRALGAGRTDRSDRRADGADGQFRGVWKAPAGTEADIRGVAGLERRLSDPENGILNPKAINTLRVFPAGVVSWGARTMDGDDSIRPISSTCPSAGCRSTSKRACTAA